MSDSEEVPTQLSDVRILAKGAGIALPGQVLGRVVVFGCHVILARLLGPEVFGLYAIGWTILKVTGLVASAGMPIGVVRMGAEEWKRNPARFRGVILQALGTALAFGTLMGLSLYVASPWLADRVFHNPELVPVMRLFAPCIALVAGLQVAASATRITQKVEFAIIAQEVVQPGLYFVLSVCALLLGGALLGVILAAVISYAVAFVVALGFVRWLFPEVTHIRAGVESVFGKLLGISVIASLAATFIAVTMWIDRLIVGALRPVAEVGVYQAMSQTSTLFAVILGSVSIIFGPMIANLRVDEDRGRMLELFRVSTKWTMYACLPILLVVWLAPREVVDLLYGAEYVYGARALVLLTIGQLLNAATGPTAPFLVMTGHHVTLMRLSGLALLTNCILGVLLVPLFGLEGAAFSTALSLGALSLASLVAVRRILGAWPYDRRFLKVVLALSATAGFLWLFLAILPAGGPWRLAWMSAGSLLVFWVVSIGVGLDGEDRAFLAIVRKIVVARVGR